MFERGVDNYNLIKSIAENAPKFSKFYTITNIDLIREYYLDSNIQKNVETILNLEEKTDRKVNFEYLIQAPTNYTSLGLSTEANQCMNRSVNFLTCELEGGVR